MAERIVEQRVPFYDVLVEAGSAGAAGQVALRRDENAGVRNRAERRGQAVAGQGHRQRVHSRGQFAFQRSRGFGYFFSVDPELVCSEELEFHLACFGHLQPRDGEKLGGFRISREGHLQMLG